MLNLVQKKSTPFSAVVIACITLVAFGVVAMISSVSAQSAEKPAPNGRLVTVYDRGTEKVLLTKAATVGGALKAAGISLDKNDTVEPAVDERLVATDYQVNIYRARPIIVVDGATRLKVMTPYQTPAQIAKDADISLQSEDITTIDRVDDIVAEGAGLRMTIERATAFTLILYGETTTAYTQEATVGAMLQEKGITVNAKDTLSVPTSTKLTPGMTVELWRDGVQTKTEVEAVEFETEEIKDADREIGFREVKTPGVPGERRVTYEIVMKNGREESRKEIQSVTTKEPKRQIEVVGIKSKVTPYTGGGNKTQWLSASVIPEGSWGAADYIVSQESGWNPNAVNVSSGACGLAQALPCSKVPGNPYDPINSLNWMNGYVTGRYGSWEAAVSFKQANGWY